MSGYQWILYLHYADRQAGQAPESETIQRVAASRAYYAAFNLARAWLERNGEGVHDHDSVHKQVWAKFESALAASEETKADWKKVGALGNGLKLERVKADYDSVVDDPAGRAGRAIRAAKKIVELLPQLKTA